MHSYRQVCVNTSLRHQPDVSLSWDDPCCASELINKLDTLANPDADTVGLDSQSSSQRAVVPSILFRC